MRGRKKTTEQHKIEGTFRDDRHGSRFNAKHLSIAPAIPDTLEAEGKKEWKRISALMVRDQILTDYDLKGLEMYCIQFDVIKEARKSLKEKGVLIPSSTRSIIRNPAWQVVKESIDIIGKISAKYGFTPVDRTKINIQKIEEVDELDGIIKSTQMKKA